jgi:rhodanese-related sulfurtransferase
MAPFPLEDILGHYGAFFVYFLIGFGFGFVLEISGFADSPRLAAQFYFKDMTVLKVMFTGIITAMVLIFLAVGLGLLDYNRVWVNPTYLWPGIVGGLIMGAGFIIGGFCPGTSLVAVSTLKFDGIFFALGALFGIFAFGESVDAFFARFWNSSYMGRFTLPQLFGLPTEFVVLGVVVFALVAFWAGEWAEQKFGGKERTPAAKFRIGSAVAVVAALAVVVVGIPTTLDRWEQIRAEKEPLLAERAVYIQGGELLSLIDDNQINVIMLDTRNEADYNIFHILDARRTDVAELPAMASDLLAKPANTVTVVMSNGEEQSTEAWKILVAESVPNVYILEGGVNCWISVFQEQAAECGEIAGSSGIIPDDELQHIFTSATGSDNILADPDPHHYELEFTPKVKIEKPKAAGSGGCG